MTRERLQVVAYLVTAMKLAFNEGKDWQAWELYETFGDRPVEEDGVVEELLYVSNQLTPKENNIIKTYQRARNGHTQS
jgi:hypothetical protein